MVGQAGQVGRVRQEWMDVLRGLATLLILTLHATLMVEWHDTEPWLPLAKLNLGLAPYRMPMLMLLSGVLLNTALRKGWATYYQGKINKVVYPLVVWAVITRMVMDPNYVWYDLREYAGPYHLWFMLFLAFFYAVAPLLERFNTLLVVIACLAASVLSPDGSKYLERLFCLMAFFFLGHHLGRHPDLLARLTSPRAALVACPAALALSAYAVTFAGSYDVVYGPLLFLPALCGIVVLATLARAVAKRGWTEPLAFLGRHSLVFYVSHYPLTYLIMGTTLQAGFGLPVVAVISLAASLGVGTALAMLSEQFGLIRSLFQRPTLAKASLPAG